LCNLLALFFEFFYPDPGKDDDERDNNADDCDSDDIGSNRNQIDKNSPRNAIFLPDDPAEAVLK
jgi:hypothetical protein